MINDTTHIGSVYDHWAIHDSRLHCEALLVLGLNLAEG